MKQTVVILCFIFFYSCSKEKRSDKKALKMQEFVSAISNYARKQNPNFIIVPQNGVELAFNNLDISEGFNQEYVNAIDGVGIEELFYFETFVSDQERLDMAQEIAKNKVVMVADFTNNKSTYNGSVQNCQDNGFLCFPREKGNYEYKSIPDSILKENANNIGDIHNAQNYLYLISDNDFSSKTTFLNALQSTNYDVLLIDAFFKGNALSKSEVHSLKTKQNGAQRLVLAYMNIGSAEKYRYYWQDKWKLHHPNWLKKEYDGYDDEIWVKFWKKDWQDIIYSGDNSKTAGAVAKQVGINHFKGDVMPADKSNFVKKLQQEGRKVAMVGDGINDSEALAQADVSIAMAHGSDIAMDVAKITLTTSDLASIPKALKLSSKTVSGVKQNLFWVFIYNIIGIPIAAGVLYSVNGFLLDPMIAGAAMAFSSVSVVLNSLRLKRIKL